ncbi:MAG: NACHT domain-containing protein [Cyanobacteria bacterium P01_H01_bin.162]
MALLESAIGGVAGTILETTFKAGGAVAKQIKGAYSETQATQKALAAAQNYVQRYEKRHCQVKVMPGLMKEPLPLEDIYTAVKLLNDDTIGAFIGIDALEDTYRAKGGRGFGQDDGERQDGIPVANAEPYLMVLGGPGIGKSTFLRKIGLEALKKDGQIERDCIPVLIELKELRDETVDLKQKLVAELETCGFPAAAAFTEASLALGKLLVLLDGLDEVPTRNLNTVIEHIEDFVDAHDQNTFVASCRIAHYRSSQGTFLTRFTDVTLAEFDDEQIEQFIRRWFRSELDQQAGTADKYWELLQKDENQATKELAQTPLLLTFLCLVYDRQQMLPTQRSTLYGKALDILLSEWSAQKRLEHDPIYEGFYPDLEKVLLAQIAYDSFEQDQLFFLKDDITRRIGDFLADTLDAPQHLDGTAVLGAIERQQGVLVERATDIYSFSHLTLQEYLTAFHIVEARLETEVIEQHLTDERWREVFLLMAGLSRNRAIDLLQALYSQLQTYRQGYPKLDRLLHWAKNSTAGSQGMYSPLAKRANALATAISFARAKSSVRAIAFPRTITSASIMASTIASNSASDSAPAAVSNFSKNIATTSAMASEIASAMASEFASAMASEIASVGARVRVRASDIAIVSNLEHLFGNPKFADLPNQLKRLSDQVPDEKGASETWQAWADELEVLWLDALGLDRADLTFNEEEAEALRDYLYATELLIRCKDAAVRIPKQAWAELEARLLMV